MNENDINVYKILNAVDNEFLTVYIEWLDSSLKLILSKPNTVLMIGEMTRSDMQFFSENLEMTLDNYIREMKDSFNVIKTDIQFHYENSILEWRKQEILRCGQIFLSPLNEIGTVSNIIGKLLENQINLQSVMEKSIHENKILTECNTKLTLENEQIHKLSASMEAELYKKFLLLLNSKKKKIRELEYELKKRTPQQKTVFDQKTDSESDGELPNKLNIDNYVKNKNIRKPILESDSDDSEFCYSFAKTSTSNNTVSKEVPIKYSQPSTSKNIQPVYQSSSDEDINLKLDESPNRDNESHIKMLSMLEDTQEDIFTD